MRIILREDVVSLGIEGDIVEVSDGYARNYLIPRSLAVEATKGNLKDLEFKRKAIEKREAKRKAEAEKFASTLEGKTLKAVVQVAEEGKLYGSVNVSDVAKLLKEQLNQDIDKRMIVLTDQIKEVGTYPVIIRVHPEVEANLTLEVTGEEVKGQEKKKKEVKETPEKEAEEQKAKEEDKVGTGFTPVHEEEQDEQTKEQVVDSEQQAVDEEKKKKPK